MYRTGVLHYPRVNHQKAGNIRPIFIQLRSHRPCNYRAGNIRSPARKGLYRSIRARAVKARNHRIFMLCKLPLHKLVCGLCIKYARIRKPYHIRCVHKIPAKVRRQYPAVKIFTAGSRIILLFPHGYAVIYLLQIFLQPALHLQLPCYLHKTRTDLFKYGIDFFTRCGNIMAAIQQIGDFVILTVPLSRRAGHRISARRITVQYICNLLYLAGIRQRTSSELCNPYSHILPFSHLHCLVISYKFNTLAARFICRFSVYTYFLTDASQCQSLRIFLASK